MKAIVWTRYGPPEVLKLQEVPKPTPKDNEVLIKIHAATVTAGDTEIRRMKLPMGFGIILRPYFGLLRPKRVTIPGMELAGEVVGIGKDVKRFKEGDHVFGTPGLRMGAYAEYVCLPEKLDNGALAIKPTIISFEEAACVTVGGMESLHFLRMGNIQDEERVLINGAGGSIGTFGVQIAKNYGASVTAVDSTGKLEMLRTIGAEEVIDYNKEDFTNRKETFDVIFDVVGSGHFGRSLKMLNKNGRYLIANPTISKIVRAKLGPKKGGRRVITSMTNYKIDDLNFLGKLMEKGKIRSVIDRTYPLEKVPEAHRYVETGQKKGSVVITVEHQYTSEKSPEP